jgi:hypothetical protein
MDSISGWGGGRRNCAWQSEWPTSLDVRQGDRRPIAIRRENRIGPAIRASENSSPRPAVRRRALTRRAPNGAAFLCLTPNRPRRPVISTSGGKRNDDRPLERQLRLEPQSERLELRSSDFERAGGNSVGNRHHLDCRRRQMADDRFRHRPQPRQQHDAHPDGRLNNAGTWNLGGGDTVSIGGRLKNSGSINIGNTGITASTKVAGPGAPKRARETAGTRWSAREPCQNGRPGAICQ